MPVVTPSEVADSLAALRGSPRRFKRMRGDNIQMYVAGVILDDDEEIRRKAADEILHIFIDGRLASYVTGAAGQVFRIPVAYWVMRSGDASPWAHFDSLQAFPIATGFQGDMIGQAVMVSRSDSEALLASLATENASQPALTQSPQGPRIQRQTQKPRHRSLKKFLDIISQQGWLDRSDERFRSMSNIHPQYADWCSKQKPPVIAFELSRFKELVSRYNKGQPL